MTRRIREIVTALRMRRGVERTECRNVEIRPGDNSIGNANAAINVEQYKI